MKHAINQRLRRKTDSQYLNQVVKDIGPYVIQIDPNPMAAAERAAIHLLLQELVAFLVPQRLRHSGEVIWSALIGWVRCCGVNRLDRTFAKTGPEGAELAEIT